MKCLAVLNAGAPEQLPCLFQTERQKFQSSPASKRGGTRGSQRTVTPTIPSRGEVWDSELQPAKSHEQDGHPLPDSLRRPTEPRARGPRHGRPRTNAHSAAAACTHQRPPAGAFDRCDVRRSRNLALPCWRVYYRTEYQMEQRVARLRPFHDLGEFKRLILAGDGFYLVSRNGLRDIMYERRCSVSEARQFARDTVLSLTLGDYCRVSYRYNGGQTADAYGKLVDGDGWYIEISIYEAAPKVLSCHLALEPMETVSGRRIPRSHR